MSVDISKFKLEYSKNSNLTPTKVTSISIAFMISYFLVVDKREWSDIR